MKLSLRWRIAIPFIFLSIISLGSLGIILNRLINQSFLVSFQERMVAELNLISDQVNLVIRPGEPYEEINERIKELSQQISARITIILPDGKVIAETEKIPEYLENHLNRPEVQRALQGQTSAESRYSTTMHSQMLYVASPIYQDNQIVAVLRLSVPQSYIDQNYQIIGKIISLATLVTVLLAVFLSIIAANYTTKPIRQLTARVKKMIGEDENLPLRLRDTSDEISQLSLTFDILSNQIVSQIAALKDERTKLETILENMADAVIMVDENDQVSIINSSALRLFRIDHSSSVQKSIVEVVRNHQIVDLCKKCKSTNKNQEEFLELQSTKTFVQAYAIPLPLIGPGNILLVFHDLTRTHHLETIRQDFISNISHELRTPLASIKALIETLQEGALEDAPAANRFLSQMEREVDNLTQMVQELLELARIESGKVPLYKKAIRPDDLINSAYSRMKLQAERAGLTIQLSVSDDLSSVNADSARISQVLLNIIHNAIKFTPPGGEITLSAFNRQNDVVFLVKDNGVGISPANLTRIFERFYKTDRSRSGGGTGLGLSISRHLVEAHGGRIWAESSEGVGSSFFFSIPKVN